MATGARFAEGSSRRPIADTPLVAVSPDLGGQYKKTRRRSLIKPAFPRPARAELERACRIALLETEGPVSVEVIHERIVRRGSVMFFGYKRPFRAISRAMCALVRQGEANLLGTGSQRQWHRPSVKLSIGGSYEISSGSFRELPNSIDAELQVPEVRR
jgi:hypothetical protein